MKGGKTMRVKNMKVKIILAALMIVLVAYGISATSAKYPATTSAAIASGDEMAALSPIGISSGMQVSSASSNGLGVGGVSGHIGTLSLWRFEDNLDKKVSVGARPIQQATFAMNDGTGKTILILTRSYTDTIWEYDLDILGFKDRALMKIMAIDPNNGDMLWEKTVVTDFRTDFDLP